MNYRYIIVKTTDVPRAEIFLTTVELKQYEHFAVEKRANEWLAGRYAVKKLASEFFNLPPKKMQVKNAKNGAPILQATGGNNLTISITHRGDYAAAAISLTSDLIGIDIEKIEPRPQGWTEQYFSNEELLADDDAYLTELWCKKEAVLKLLGLGLTVPATQIKIIDNEVKFFGKALDVWAFKGSPRICFEMKILDNAYKFVLAYPAII
ncbi:MAG: 4'-phosphopantetheinyl transferase superfamily protein [Elusimicrobiaceae bacterium]|nr:4'-phosphopantetheinyl transferase superfamily protein [Elusimicrobiaceae bacterium]